MGLFDKLWSRKGKKFKVSTPTSRSNSSRLNQSKTEESDVKKRNRLTTNLDEPHWHGVTSASRRRRSAQRVSSVDFLPVQSKPTPRKKRPVTLATSSNIKSKRRGHKEGLNHPDNISRTSSRTNLDSLEAEPTHQGAKPRKGDGKKAKNNNLQVESGPPSLRCSVDSLQENSEIQRQLRQQLREMADEKSSLALQLGEQRGQLSALQTEIAKLKVYQEESSMEMERLSEENAVLRNRLRDVSHSPLSDNEKQQLLLFESRHHSSAPASIATNVLDDDGAASRPLRSDWDKASSGDVSSEFSVACLQDKINQMQETHYSTNEELQATLQELTDLQRQLTELQQENERLNDEKSLMFDSLCRQTERLTDSRQEVDNLKHLLYKNDESGSNQFESAEKLVEMVRAGRDEVEQLLLKLDRAETELREVRTVAAEQSDVRSQLTERVKTLEGTLDAKQTEHKRMDRDLTLARDRSSGQRIEIDRLSDLLENARTRIGELEQDRAALGDKSELDELLDNARKEKDQLESEITYLKEQLALSKNEIEKLKEQVFVLQEECKVTRNNAKTTQSDLEYKLEKLGSEKTSLAEQLQQFQEGINELQVQAQCHTEERRQLSAVLSETQRNLSETERKSLNLEKELHDLKKLRAEENDEWEKFQNDLLTSVRVANDFKTEAQQELQKIILENKTYREQVRLLEGQLDQFKGVQLTATGTQTDIILPPIIVNLTKNIDPVIANRLSAGTYSDSDMERLFPALSKERRSKSKENLPSRQSSSTGSGRGLKKSKSRDDLDQIDSKPTGEEGKLPKSFLKWTRSKENLAEKSNMKKSKSKESLNTDESKSSVKVKRREKKRPKFISVEEETLLNSLNNWYQHIDPNTPDELLTEEDRAVRKLKTLYEDDTLKEKPVAHKPKDNLAISRPLLTSVVHNPKLEKIFKDPDVPSIVTEVRNSALDDDYSETHYEGATATDHVRFSEIQPSDSVSIINNNLPKPNIYVNYENLDNIVAAIPHDGRPLSEDQKFALKLKTALDEAEQIRQPVRKSIRGMEISAPTLESVENNDKLKEILINPNVRYASSTSDLTKVPQDHRMTKSYEDISFSFASKNTLLNAYFGDQIEKSPYFSESGSSFTSAEFDVDKAEQSKEDLLYNATQKKTNRQSKEIIKKMIDNLNDQELEEDEAIHHWKIVDARERYKEELQLALRRLEHDELRSSMRKKIPANDMAMEPESSLSDEIAAEVSIRLEEPKEYQAEIEDFKEFQHAIMVKPPPAVYNIETSTPVVAEIKKHQRQDEISPMEESAGEEEFQVEIEDFKSYDDVLKVETPSEENTFQIQRFDDLTRRDSDDLQAKIQLFREFQEAITKKLNRRSKNNTLGSVSDVEPNREEYLPEIQPFEGFQKAKFEDLEKSFEIIHQLHTFQQHSSEEFQVEVEHYREFEEAKLDLHTNYENSTLVISGHLPPAPIEFSDEISCKSDLHYHTLDWEEPEECEADFATSKTTVDDFHHGASALDTEDEFTDSELMERLHSVETGVDDQGESGKEIVKLSTKAKVPKDYSLKQIEKENRYGVISPLNLRFSYRTVVKEYKSKLPHEEVEEQVCQMNIEEEPISDNDSSRLSVQEDDDINVVPLKDIEVATEPVKAVFELEDGRMLQSESDDNSCQLESMSDIDREMEDIMATYLHTGPSRLIHSLPKPRKFEPSVEEEPNDGPLSLEDVEFIEEMKKKYSIQSGTDPSHKRGRRSRPLSEINDYDLKLIENIGKMNLDDVSSTPPPLSRSPLSDVGDHDLKQIDEISELQMDDENIIPPPPLPRSPIPNINEGDRQKSPPPVPKTRFIEYNKIPPPLPKSSIPAIIVPERPESPPMLRSPRLGPVSPSARLSDLMYTETVFVPVDQQPPQRSQYQRRSYFEREKETVFVPSPSNTLSTHLKREWLDDPQSYKPVYVSPKPTPRKRYLDSTLVIMTDLKKNSCDVENRAEPQEVGLTPAEKDQNDIPGQSRDVILVDQSPAQTNILKPTVEAEGQDNTAAADKTSLDEDSGEAGGAEALSVNHSNVNLFHMDSKSSLAQAYNSENPEFTGESSVPKILDFIPLDEDTTPVFTKDDPSYDTLDRQQAYHVLEQAAQLRESKPSSVEVISEKPSLSKIGATSSSHSRTSFTRARKLFEALEEANKDDSQRNSTKGRESLYGSKN